MEYTSLRKIPTDTRKNVFSIPINEYYRPWFNAPRISI